ncbi:MAG: hypothetical protein GY701_22920 [Sulfitobacter sp.]|nr:hypothetical protein [Sulfitobacter sp.]
MTLTYQCDYRWEEWECELEAGHKGPHQTVDLDVKPGLAYFLNPEFIHYGHKAKS